MGAGCVTVPIQRCIFLWVVLNNEGDKGGDIIRNKGHFSKYLKSFKASPQWWWLITSRRYFGEIYCQVLFCCILHFPGRDDPSLLRGRAQDFNFGLSLIKCKSWHVLFPETGLFVKQIHNMFTMMQCLMTVASDCFEGAFSMWKQQMCFCLCCWCAIVSFWMLFHCYVPKVWKKSWLFCFQERCGSDYKKWPE